MATFNIKRGDRLPVITDSLVDPQGLPLDLTEAIAVGFRLRPRGTDLPVVSGGATITDAVGGLVQYAWASGDTGLVGLYDAEWIITWEVGYQVVPGLAWRQVYVAPTLLDPYGGDVPEAPVVILPPTTYISVPSLAALAGFDAQPLEEGSLVWVVEVEDLYVLRRPSPAGVAVDGVAVVEAVGGGEWIARDYGRWDDLSPSVTQSSGAGLTTAPFPNNVSPFSGQYFRHGTIDVISLIYQLPHKWDFGVVYPHIHVVACADPAGNRVARFDFGLQWMRFGAGYLPAYADWPDGIVDYSVTSANWNKHQVVSFGPLSPPADSRESTILMIAIRRVGNAVQDTYSQSKAWGTGADNLLLMSADLHYRRAKSGSLVQFYIPE